MQLESRECRLQKRGAKSAGVFLSRLTLYGYGDESLNIKSQKVIPMCEILERKQAHPYESDADKTDEEIMDGLMEITALSLTDVTADEPAYE